MSLCWSITFWKERVFRSGTLGSCLLVGTASCAGEASLPTPSSRGGAIHQTRDDDDEQVNSDSESGESVAINPAPGMAPVEYPLGPYGTKAGAKVENLELYGWRNPSGVSFDLERTETIRMSDFYNPAGAGQGIEYILLNVVASWCGVCRSEYSQMDADQVYAALAPRGLEIVGVLYEDNNSEPSRLVDMTNWAQAFAVAFPFANDPGFKTGRFFDRSATPMNMLIDARTMQIVQVGTGYRPDMFDEIDVMLQARGR
jgi:hypothetical protein